MSGYWLGRLLQTIPLLFGVSVIVFVVLHLAPGDPTTLVADPSFLTQDQLAALRVQLGLDEPWPVQYVTLMEGMAGGTLVSFRTHLSTSSMILDALPTTASVV